MCFFNQQTEFEQHLNRVNNHLSETTGRDIMGNPTNNRKWKQQCREEEAEFHNKFKKEEVPGLKEIVRLYKDKNELPDSLRLTWATGDRAYLFKIGILIDLIHIEREVNKIEGEDKRSWNDKQAGFEDPYFKRPPPDSQCTGERGFWKKQR
jgi:hypothetical protein